MRELNLLNKFLVVAIAVVTFVAVAQAQITEKKSLTLDGAKKVIEAAKAEAKKLNALQARRLCAATCL